jgi:hypothetical protein
MDSFPQYLIFHLWAYRITRYQINFPAKQFTQPAEQSSKLEQANLCPCFELNQNVQVALLVRLFSRVRAEKIKILYGKLFQVILE